MREIALTDGTTHTVYDTSGPYTDPDAKIDVRAGLHPLREKWIEARNDTETLDRPTSLYRRGREAMAELDGVRFSGKRTIRRAKPGANVSQMHYARRGEITPEMEFIAMREGVDAGIRARRSRARPRDHSGEHQSSRKRTDDHRPQLPREDQREHRQLGRHLDDRRRSREDDVGDALGRRHGDGSFDRQEHPRNARVDSAQLARADRHGADLSGARKSQRQS